MYGEQSVAVDPSEAVFRNNRTVIDRFLLVSSLCKSFTLSLSMALASTMSSLTDAAGPFSMQWLCRTVFCAGAADAATQKGASMAVHLLTEILPQNCVGATGPKGTQIRRRRGNAAFHLALVDCVEDFAGLRPFSKAGTRINWPPALPPHRQQMSI